MGKRINEIPWPKTREQESKIYQLICGCNMTNEKLHMINKLSSPECEYCGRVDTMNHRIEECPKYQKTRLEMTKIMGKLEIKEEDVLTYDIIWGKRTGPLLVCFC